MKSEADRGRNAFRLSFHSSSSALVPEEGSGTVVQETGRSGSPRSTRLSTKLEAEAKSEARLP